MFLHNYAQQKAKKEFEKLRKEALNGLDNDQKKATQISHHHLQHNLQLFMHRNVLAISVLAFSVGAGVALFGFALLVSDDIEYFAYDFTLDGKKDKVKPIFILSLSAGIILSIGTYTAFVAYLRGMILWCLIREIEKNMRVEERGIALPRIVSYSGEALLLAAVFVMAGFTGLVVYVSAISYVEPNPFVDVYYNIHCDIINGTKDC